jgi:hypothetical protein
MHRQNTDKVTSQQQVINKLVVGAGSLTRKKKMKRL